jgi:hypothetical protein
MYQDILDAIGRGYFKEAVTNTHGFTMDDKILTGVNTPTAILRYVLDAFVISIQPLVNSGIQPQSARI